jgi:hypothetical protein
MDGVYSLCSILKNTDQCIVSCYATNYTEHPRFRIMLKIVPIDGIGLSCVALAARDFGTWQCCRAQVQV